MSYKFTNKETGEVKYGNPVEFGEGYETFVMSDGEQVHVNNEEMNGSNLNSEKYTVEASDVEVSVPSGIISIPIQEGVGGENADEVNQG